MSLKIVEGVPTLEDLLRDNPHLLVVAVESLTVDVGLVAAQLQRVLDLPPGRRPMVVMSFNGFDEDPREVDEIPEVRAWCRRFLESPAASTLVALADETEPPDDPMLREALVHAVGRCKFVILAGYGHREGQYVRLSPDGQALVVALSQLQRGEVS